MVLLLVVGDFWQCFVIFWVANNIAILKSDLLALRRMRTCSLLVSPMSGLLTILEFLDSSCFLLFFNLYSKLMSGRDAVDKDGDGDISKEEFVKNAMNSKFIHNMLKG